MVQDPSQTVALCPACGQVPPSLSPDEYTPQRAALILERGLCVCPGDTVSTASTDSESQRYGDRDIY